MGKGKRKTVTIPAEAVRQHLFFTWCAIFLAYVCTFLFSSVKEDVGFPLAIDATWKVAYLIVPVLGAFAGFWFGPAASDDSADEVVRADRRKLMFILTGVLHGFVFLIIVVGILLEDFADREEPASYPQRVDMVIKFMLLIWSVSLLPVGWLLKGVKVQIGQVDVQSSLPQSNKQAT